MNASGPTLLKGVGVIDGTDGSFQENAALLFEGGRIVAVASYQELQTKTTHVIDLGDAVLLPGFVDAHTHLTIRPGDGDQHGQLAAPVPWQTLRGFANVRRMLASGVTSARIMGERAGIDLAFKRAIQGGELVGPHLSVATEALSATHGHGAALGIADGVEGVRQAVRRNIRQGADLIKIFMTGGVSSTGSSLHAYHYSREEVRTVVAEAHRAGLRVAAHAHGGEGVIICAEEGVDSIEHGGLLTDADIAAMTSHGTWLVLTNSIAFHPEGIEKGDAASPEIIDKMRQVRNEIAQSFQRVQRSRLRFALGTDSMHGHFGDELIWLVEHGVKPEAALVAATRHGAEVLGQLDRVGTLELGKRADVIALRGNPLQDIRAVMNVVAVFKSGELVVDRREAF